MSYLAPPKTFELQLHWYQTASQPDLPLQLASEFETLNNSNEFIVLGTIKNRVRFTATVFNSTIGAPVQYYDAFSVQVGDWIANNASGYAWRITQIYTVQDNRYQQTDALHFFAKIIDYASYNRGIDKRGRGIGSPNNVDSAAVLFTTDNYGMPILSGLDTNAIDANFATVLQSRFAALNIKRRFISITQSDASTTFNSGDPIYIDPVSGLYKKANGLQDSNIVQYTIGVVTSVGIPNADNFTFSPFGEYRSVSEIGLTGPIGTIFYIDPTGLSQFTTVRPEKFPYPVYQIIDSESNVILVKGDIFGIENYDQLSTLRAQKLEVGEISALEKGGLIKFSDAFYASSATISTLNTDGVFFRSQNTTSTLTMLYADNTNILYWDGKPLIPAPPAPYVLPSTIQVSSIKTANISGLDSTSAIVFSNPINVPVIQTSSIQTSSIQANGLYLSNSNVTGLLTTDPSLTLLWNGAPIGSGGGGGKTLSSYNNLTTSSFSVSSIGSLYSSDVIYFKNPFAASEASISTLKTGGLLISGGLLNADTNLNLYWNGKPIGQGGSAISSYTTLAASSFSVSSIKAATSSGTIYFENAFQGPTANMSSLITQNLRIEDANNTGAYLQTDSNLQLLWNGKPIAQGSALSTFDSLYTNSLAVSSIKAISGSGSIYFESNVSMSTAQISSISAYSLSLASGDNKSALLQTDANLQLLWNGKPISGSASSQTISTFEIITASTVVTNGISLASESGSAFLQTNTNLELLFNGKPVGQSSSTFSTLTTLDLTVSSIKGTSGSIVLNGKLLASDATINNLYTNGIIFQSSTITSSILGSLYADDKKDLYWNGKKVIQPPVSSFNNLTTSSLKVSTIVGFSSSDAIYFANPIKVSTVHALNIGLQGQSTSSSAYLYALSDLSLMWNGKAVINNTGLLEISTIKVGTLQSQNPGSPLVFKSPIQAGRASVKALASEAISLKYKPTENQMLGAAPGPSEGVLIADTGNNLLWNGKQLITNSVSTFFVSSIGGFSSSDAVNFTGPIKATVANVSTLSASGLELTGQASEKKATLYTDSQLNLFWNNKPLVDNKFPDIYVGAINALQSTQAIQLKNNLVGLKGTFSSLQTAELSLSFADKSSLLHTDAQLNLLWNGVNITGFKSTILTSTLITSLLYAHTARISSISTNGINFANGGLLQADATQLLFNGLPIGTKTTFDDIKVSSITGTSETIEFTTKIAASEASILNLNTQTITISDAASGNLASLQTDGSLNLLWNGKPINSNTASQSSTLTISTISAFTPSDSIRFLNPIIVPNITTSSVVTLGLGLRYNNTSTFLYTNEKKELIWNGKPLINNKPGSLTDKLILSTLAVSSIGSLDSRQPLYITSAVAAANIATSSIIFNGKALYASTTNDLIWDGGIVFTSKTSSFVASSLSLNTLYVSTISSLSGLLTINSDVYANKIATENLTLGLASNNASLTTNESLDLLWNGKPVLQSNTVISSFTALFASTASISTLSTTTIVLAGRNSTTSGELYADASLNLFWNGRQLIKTETPGSDTLKISSILVSTIGALFSSDTLYITSKVYVEGITVSSVMTNTVVFKNELGEKSLLRTEGNSIYFNNTPLISTSLTISSIRVSTISGQDDSITLTSKLIGPNANISSINTNGLILDYLDKSGVLTTDDKNGLLWNGKPVIQGTGKEPATLHISSIFVSSIGSLTPSDQIVFRNTIRASDAIIASLQTDSILLRATHSTTKALLQADSSLNLIWNGVPLMQNTSTISIGDLQTSRIKAPIEGETIQIRDPIKAPSVEATGLTLSYTLEAATMLSEGVKPNTLQANGANQITWNGVPLITDTISSIRLSSIIGLNDTIDFVNQINAPAAKISNVVTAVLELTAASTSGKLTMDNNILLWNGSPLITKSSTPFASTIYADGINLIGKGTTKSSLLYADRNLNLFWNGAPLANTPGSNRFSSIEVSTISALNPNDSIYFANSIQAPVANLSVITTTLININSGSLTTNANNELTWNGQTIMPSSMSVVSSFNTLSVNNIGSVDTGGTINFISPFTGSTASLSTLNISGINLTGINTTTNALLYADKDLRLFWNGKPMENTLNNLNISSLAVSSISAKAGSSTVDFTDPIKVSVIVLESNTTSAKLYTDDALNLYWNNLPLNSGAAGSKFSSIEVSSINAATPGTLIRFADAFSSENAQIGQLRTTGILFDSVDSTASGLLQIDNNMNLIWNGSSLTQAEINRSSINVSTIGALKPGDTIYFVDKFLVSSASIGTLDTTGIRISGKNTMASALLQTDSSLALLWNGKPLIDTSKPSSIQISSIVVSFISAENPSSEIVFENSIKVPTVQFSANNNLSLAEGSAYKKGTLYTDAEMNLYWDGTQLNMKSSIQVSSISASANGGTINFTDSIVGKQANISSLKTSGLVIESNGNKTALLNTDDNLNLLWNGKPLISQNSSTISSFVNLNVSTIFAYTKGQPIVFGDTFVAKDATINLLETEGLKIRGLSTNETAILSADDKLNLFWNGQPIQNLSIPSSLNVLHITVSSISGQTSSAIIDFNNPIKTASVLLEYGSSRGTLQTDANLNLIWNGVPITAAGSSMYISSVFTDGLFLLGQNSNISTLLYADASQNLFWNGTKLNSTGPGPALFSTIAVSTITALNPQDNIFLANNLIGSTAAISTIKTSGLTLQSETTNQQGLLYADKDMNLVWNGSTIGKSGQTSSKFQNISVSSISALSSGQTIYFNDSFFSNNATISTLNASGLNLTAKGSSASAFLTADAQLNLYWNNKPINSNTQPSTLSVSSLIVSSISAANPNGVITFANPIEVSSINTSRITLTSQSNKAQLYTDDSLTLFWNGSSISGQPANTNSSTLFVSTLITDGILIVSRGTTVSSLLYANEQNNLFWNGKPLNMPEGSNIFSTIRVSSIAGLSDTETIFFSSKFSASEAAVSTLSITKLWINSETGNKSALYVDKDLNLVWNGVILNVSTSSQQQQSSTFNGIYVSSISALNPGGTISFLDNFQANTASISTFNTTGVSIQGINAASGLLYADKNLNLIWNGIPLRKPADQLSTLSISSLLVSSISGFPGETIQFNAPIKAENITANRLMLEPAKASSLNLGLYVDEAANLFWNGAQISGLPTKNNSSMYISSVITDGLFLIGKDTAKSSLLYADDNLELFWNGKPINQQQSGNTSVFSTIMVSSISALSSGLKIYFNDSISVSEIDASTVITKSLFLVGTDTKTQTNLYANKDQELYWGSKQVLNAPVTSHSSLKVSTISGISTGEKVTFIDSIVAPDIKVTKVLLGENTPGSLYTDSNLNLLWNGTILGTSLPVSTSILSTFSSISVGSINGLGPDEVIVFNAIFEAKEATIGNIKTEGLSLISKNDPTTASLLYADENRNLIWNGKAVFSSTNVATYSTFTVSSIQVSTISAFSEGGLIEFLNPIKTSTVLLSAGPDKYGILHTDENLTLFWNGSSISGSNNSSTSVVSSFKTINVGQIGPFSPNENIYFTAPIDAANATISTINTTGIAITGKNTTVSSFLYADEALNLYWNGKPLIGSTTAETLTISSIIVSSISGFNREDTIVFDNSIEIPSLNLRPSKTLMAKEDIGASKMGKLYTDNNLNLFWNGTSLLLQSTLTVSSIITDGIFIAGNDTNNRTQLYANKENQLYWGSTQIINNPLTIHSSLRVSTISALNPGKPIIFKDPISAYESNISSLKTTVITLEAQGGRPAATLYADKNLNLIWNGSSLTQNQSSSFSSIQVGIINPLPGNNSVYFGSPIVASTVQTGGIIIRSQNSALSSLLYADKSLNLYWQGKPINEPKNQSTLIVSSIIVSSISAFSPGETIVFNNQIQTQAIKLVASDMSYIGSLYADNKNLFWNGAQLNKAFEIGSSLYVSSLITDGLILKEKDTGISTQLYTEKGQLYWSSVQIINAPVVSHEIIQVSTIAALNGASTIYFKNSFSADAAFVSSLNIAVLEIQAKDTKSTAMLYADEKFNLFWNGKPLGQTAASKNINVSSIGSFIPGQQVNFTAKIVASDASISSLQTDGLVFRAQTNNASSILYADSALNLIWNGVQLNMGQKSEFSTLKASTFQTGTIGSLSTSEKIYFTNSFYASDATISTIFTSAVGIDKGILRTDANLNLLWNNEPILKSSVYISTLYVRNISSIIPNEPIIFDSDFLAKKATISSLNTDEIYITKGRLYTNSNSELFWNGQLLNQVSSFSTFKILSLEVSSIGSSDTIYFNTKFVASDAYIKSLGAESIGVVNKETGISSQLTTDKNQTLLWNGKPLLFSERSSFSTIFVSTIGALSGSTIIFTSRFNASDATINTINTKGLLISPIGSNKSSLLYADTSLDLRWNNNKILVQSTFIKVSSLLVSSIGGFSDLIQFNTPFGVSSADISTLGTGLIKLGPQGISLYTDSSKELFWNGKPLLKSSFVSLQVSTFSVSTIVALSPSESIYFKSNISSATANISSLNTSEILFVSSNTKLALAINPSGELTWTGVPLIKRDSTISISTLRTNNIRPEIDSGSIRFDGPIETRNIMTRGLSLISETALQTRVSTFRMENRPNELYVNSQNILIWNGQPVTTNKYSTLFVSCLTALTASDSLVINSNILAPSAFISTISTTAIYLPPNTVSNISSALYNSSQILYWDGRPVIDPSTLSLSTLNVPDIVSHTGILNVKGKLNVSVAAFSTITSQYIYLSDMTSGNKGKLQTDTDLNLFWNNLSLTEGKSTFSTIYVGSVAGLNPEDAIYFKNTFYASDAVINKVTANGILLEDSTGKSTSLLYTDANLKLYWNSTVISGANDRFSTIYVSSISALGPSEKIYFNNTFYASDAAIGKLFTNGIVLNNSTNTTSSILYADTNLVLYWNNKPLIGGSNQAITSSFSSIYVSSIGSLRPSDTINFANPLVASEATIPNLLTNRVSIRNSTNTISSVLYTDDNLVLYWNDKPLSGGQPSGSQGSSFSTIFVSTISALNPSDTIYFTNSFYASDATIKKIFTSGIVISELSGATSSLLYTSSNLVLYWNNVPLSGQSSSFSTLFVSSIGAQNPGASISFLSPISSQKANISTLYTTGIELTSRESSINGLLYADSTLNLYWNGKPLSGIPDPLKVSSLIVSTISGFASSYTIFFNNNFAGSTAQISTISNNGIILTARNSTQQGLLYSDDFMTLFWNGKPIQGSSFNTLYASDAVIDILFASDAIIGSLKASDAVINKLTASDGSFHNILTNYIGSENKIYFTAEYEAQRARISDLTVGSLTLEDYNSGKKGILNTDEKLNLYWNSTLITTSSYKEFNIDNLKVSSIGGINSEDIIYFVNPFAAKTANVSSLQTGGISFEYVSSVANSSTNLLSSIGLLYADLNKNLIWNGKRLNLDPSTLSVAAIYASSINALDPSGIIDVSGPLAAQKIILKSSDNQGVLNTDNSLNLYWNGILIAYPQSQSSLSYSTISSLFVSTISALHPNDTIIINNPFAASTATISTLKQNGAEFTGRDTQKKALLYANSNLDLYWNDAKLLVEASTLHISSLFVSSISAESPSDIIYFNNSISVGKAVISTVQTNGVILTGADSTISGLLYANSSLQLFWNGMPIAMQMSSLSSLTIGSLNVGYLGAGAINASSMKASSLTAGNGTISSISTNGIFFTGRDSSETGLLYSDKNLELYWNGNPISKIISSFERFTISSLEVSSVQAYHISASDATVGKLIASDATLWKLFASDAFIGHLQASDASISRLRASDGYFNNIVTNYIGGNDTLYFTSPFTADIGIISTVDANGLYLTGRSSFAKGLLHTDSSLVLYWNGSSIAGLQQGIGGSTFSTLYASTAYINNLLASDAQIYKLTASDGNIFTLYSSDANIANISAGKAAIFTTLTNFLGAIPVTQTVLLGVTEPVIQFTSPFTAGTGNIAQFSASDAYINTLYASDAFIHRITASDAKINNIFANYIGGQQDNIYFTSPFQADIGNTSTINANGLYLTGRSSFAKGLLHTDASLVLYWNGSSIAGQQPGTGGIGGSTFSTLYAMRAYINYLYASDSYLQRLWASDAIIGQASVSTGSISSLRTSLITADEGIITQVATNIISLPTATFKLGATLPTAIQFTSPFQATSASFVQIFASDARIHTLQASDAFINHLTASDAKINNIVANYIGGQQDIIYFTSPFQTDIGNASTLNANGLYLTGRSSFARGLLHTDSSLVLYWNGSSIAGQQPGSGGTGGSTFSTLFAMRAYINYLYASDSYLQRLWASDATIGNASVSTALISTVQASKVTANEGTLTTIATSFIGAPTTQLRLGAAANQIQFTSPFQATSARFVKLFASDANIDQLQASDAFINHITASDAKVNNVIANYIGSQQDNIYFTSPFQADNGHISSVNANGLYLTGASSFVKGLLYTDSSLVLYWNGSSIAGQQPGTGGTGGSTFSTLYAMRAYINHLYASDSYLQRLWASDATIGNASVSTGQISTFQASKGTITTIETSFIGAPKGLLGFKVAKEIKFISPFQAVEGRFAKLYASDAYINLLQASDAFINHITASDAKVNNVIANYIGSQQDNIYFTSPFQADNGQISSINANGLYLTGASSFVKGLLYTDSSLVLYWNGSSIAGQQPGTGGIGGSTFSTLYALRAYINYLYASDSYLQKLWASDATIGNASVSTAKISTIQASNIAAVNGSITTLETSFIGAPAAKLTVGSVGSAAAARLEKQIQFTSPFQAVMGRFTKLFASDARIYNLQASDAIINRLTASDANVNNIVANYIGGSHDNLYFTSPFQGPKGSLSTVDANGLYLTGVSSLNTGLLYTDSNLTLYWNGSSIAGQVPGIGGSTFSTLYAYKAYINYLYASDAFISSAKISTIQSNEASIKTVLTSFIGAPKTQLMQAKGNTIQFTSPFQAIAGRFIKLYASDGDINLLKSSDAFINRLTASDAKINNLVANYIGGSQDNIYFTSPFQAESGIISTVSADGLYLTGISSFKKGLLHTDSTLTLYWNGSSITGSNVGGSTFSTLYAMRAYINYLYASDSYLQKLWASDATIGNASVSTLQASQVKADNALLTTIATNFIGAQLPTSDNLMGQNKIQFTSPFQAIAGGFVKLYASDGSIDLLTASDAFIHHITASDAKINNIRANYIGGSENNIYFTSPFVADEGGISTLSGHKANIDYIYVKDGSISTLEGSYANISTISTINLVAEIGEILRIGTNIIGLPETLYTSEYLMYTGTEYESTFISSYTSENEIQFISPFQGLTGRLNKLIASDVNVNNILANYIGGENNDIYFTSPFIGPEGTITNLFARSASISTLGAGHATISSLRASDASIHFLRASDAKIDFLRASDAKIKNLKVSRLIVTDSKVDNLLVSKLKILDNLSVDSFHTIDSFNSKLVASDTIINNITANYIGSNDDLLYITSPFKGSHAYIDKVVASDADIKWLRINKIGVIQPTIGNQTIEFVSKFEATAAKINVLEVSSLIFTDAKQAQSNILIATGPSQKLGNRLLYKIDNNHWMGSKINSNDKNLSITTVKWNGTMFLASGLSGNKAILLTSKDGITWDVINTVLDYQEINSIIWYKQMWLIAGLPKSGTSTTLLKSVDGVNWSVPAGFSDRNTIYSKLVHNEKRILALGKKSGSNLAVIIHSADGINWFNSETPSFNIVANSAAWDGKIWIAVGKSASDPTKKSIMRSTNGSKWTNSITGFALRTGKDILWNSKHNCWLACGKADDEYKNDLRKYANNTILRSTDGFVWTQVTQNPSLTATNTLLWQEPYFIASGNTNYKDMRISHSNTSIIKSKDGLHWTPYVNHHKGFISPHYGCLEKATYANINRTNMNQNNIRTITFELSSPEIQHHEITHNDKLIMVKFRKSANAIFASEENLQIHIYGSYFKTGHTIKIQCIPYEVGEMTLEEYTNAKYTLHSPNNELSMETTSPYSDAAILSQRNILHITFYDGHWIKTYSV